MFFVYCQFSNKQAEVYEFPEHVHYAISDGNLQILVEAGITGFNRVTVDDMYGYREVWRRPSRNDRNNNPNN